jgi:cytoskeletal protein CcmA (bactofilin family)
MSSNNIHLKVTPKYLVFKNKTENSNILKITADTSEAPTEYQLTFPSSLGITDNTVKNQFYVDTSGAITVGESVLDYSQGISMCGDLVMNGTGNIYVSSGDINVTGGLTISGDINLTGNSTITGDSNITGDAKITGDLDISGSLTVTTNSQLGTVTSGIWQGTAIADTYLADNLTISGGTIDNSVIGGTTPASATLTSLDARNDVVITGSVTLASGDLNISNYSDINTSGNLTVQGNTTFNSGIVSSGDIQIFLDGDDTFIIDSDGTVRIDANIIKLNSNVSIQSDVKIDGGISIANQTNIDDSLYVSGNVLTSGNMYSHNIYLNHETTTPSTPANGDGGILYTKSDGRIYWISNDLDEIDISGGGLVDYSQGISQSGNLLISGTGDITVSSGNIKLTGNLNVKGNINVTGTVIVSENVNISDNLNVTDNVGITGTLTVKNTTYLQSTVKVSGNILASGSVYVSGDIAVTGDIHAHKLDIYQTSTTPSTPSQGGVLYTKNDDKLYWISTDGIETDVTLQGTGDVNTGDLVLSTGNIDHTYSVEASGGLGLLKKPDASSTGDLFHDAFSKTDDWLFKNLVDTPPAPTLNLATITTTDVIVLWNSPTQYDFGLLDTRIPNITSTTIEGYGYNSGTLALTTLDNTTTTITATGDLPGASKPVEGVAFTYEADEGTYYYDYTTSGILSSDAGLTDYKKIKRIKLLNVAGNAAYLEPSSDSDIYIRIYYGNNNTYLPKKNLNTIAPDDDGLGATLDVKVVGVPAVVQNMGFSVNSSTSFTVTWEKPLDHDVDIAGNQTTPAMDDYYVTTIPSSTLRYGGLASTTTLTQTHSHTDGTESLTKDDLLPGTVYVVEIKGRNIANSSYGASSNITGSLTTYPSVATKLSSKSDLTFSSVYFYRNNSGVSWDGDTMGSLTSVIKYSDDSAVYALNKNDLPTTLTCTSISNIGVHTAGQVTSTGTALSTLNISSTGNLDVKTSGLITFDGFGHSAESGTTTAGFAQVEITNNRDYHNDEASKYQGFYLDFDATVGITKADLTANNTEYKLAIVQDADNSEKKTMGFYVDDLNTASNPTALKLNSVSSGYTFHGGVMTLNNSSVFNFDTNVDYLGQYFLYNGNFLTLRIGDGTYNYGTNSVGNSNVGRDKITYSNGDAVTGDLLLTNSLVEDVDVQLSNGASHTDLYTLNTGSFTVRATSYNITSSSGATTDFVPTLDGATPNHIYIDQPSITVTTTATVNMYVDQSAALPSGFTSTYYHSSESEFTTTDQTRYPGRVVAGDFEISTVTLQLSPHTTSTNNIDFGLKYYSMVPIYSDNGGSTHSIELNYTGNVAINYDKEMFFVDGLFRNATNLSNDSYELNYLGNYATGVLSAATFSILSSVAVNSGALSTTYAYPDYSNLVDETSWRYSMFRYKIGAVNAKTVKIWFDTGTNFLSSSVGGNSASVRMHIRTVDYSSSSVTPSVGESGWNKNSVWMDADQLLGVDFNTTSGTTMSKNGNLNCIRPVNGTYPSTTNTRYVALFDGSSEIDLYIRIAVDMNAADITFSYPKATITETS